MKKDNRFPLLFLTVFIIAFVGLFYWNNRWPSATVLLKDAQLELLVANTPVRRAKGLGGRKTLGKYDGMIFIFDRYANDILIDPLRYKHSLSAKFTKKILTLFPKPNLWIFLNPPFRTVKSRKNELQDVELKRQISEYSKFFRNKKNILVLNTRVPKKKLIEKILKKIKELVE